MKRRIEQLINGRFEYEAPVLVTSESEICLQIQEGKNKKGEFSVGAQNGSRVKGVVTSDHRRIVLASERFSGNTCRILYGIDTQGLHCGDQVSGNLVLSSNIGERKIPVNITIVETHVETAGGTIRTLDDFMRFAMKDQREAFRLFTGTQFEKILNGKNRIYTALYKGMSHNPVTYQHMEEFLIASGKKEPILLSLDKDKKGVYQVGHSLKDTLYIYKSTWGYVRMEIEAQGDFLEIEKKVVTTDDFIGKIYGLEYIIRKDRLGNGKHYGKIVIRNVHQTLEFEIEASVDKGECLAPQGLKRRQVAEMSRDFLDLQLHRMDYRTWYEKTINSMEELKEADCMDTMLFLYQAYVLQEQEETEQARELLLHIGQTGMIKTPREQGVFLYLARAAGLLPQEEQNIFPKLKAYVQQQPSDYILLKLLLEEEKGYREMPVQMLQMMEQAYELGCRSPFLYLDAWRVLSRQEGLLRKLSPFMIQVLNFARKQKVLRESLLKRAAYLADHLKEFHPAVYRLLQSGYEQFPSDEVLEAICKLIMKGTPVRREYFPWYRLAVEHQIRITRLYEYYIETMEEGFEGVLPQVIRMYFSYNNTLSAQKKAFVYANVIRNKEQDKITYLNYQKAMKQFASEQLARHRINEDFAVVYQEVFRTIEDKKTAHDMIQVLFTHKVTVQDPNIRNVIVCHDALRKEQVYPVSEHCAYVRIYGDNAQLLFEDEKRRRYASTVSYQTEKLMEERGLARECAKYDRTDAGLLLYLCRELPSLMEVNGKTLCNYQRAAVQEAFTPGYQNVIRKKLLEYYLLHPQDPETESYLHTTDLMAYARMNRKDTLQVLVSHGMYEQAFEVISQLGTEGVDDVVLMKIASRMILKYEFREEEELVYLAKETFERRKYDEIILTYLRDYLVGSLEQMCLLWEKLKGFQLDTYKLDERILIFAMYVRGFPKQDAKILKSYIMQQGKEKIILAYLTYISCAYFLGGVQVDEQFFEYLERILEREWEMDIVCRLALLKYYASRETLTGRQERQSVMLLKEFDQKGLRFAFYQELPSTLTQAYQVEDKVFVEERFPKGSKVVLRYALHRKEQEPLSFRSEPLKESYQGIFVKEFLLFYGETLTYELIVEYNGETFHTPQKELTIHGVEAKGRTRYKLLNRILAARALNNQEAMYAALKLYVQQETFVDQVFQLMD